jgi:Zn-dependent membrane protease YugP
MWFDINYLFWVFLPTLALTLFAQWWIRSSFARASQIPNMQRVSGAQAARRILDSAGLSHVSIESTAPVQSLQLRGARATASLDDHYDPRDKVLRLSPAVYAGTSVAALGVAAHEAGHAIQDAQAYPWMRARSAIVPAANIGTQLGFILVFVGLILSLQGLAWLGVVAFALGTVFALLTLPVELNASSRAMQMLTANGLVDRIEYGEARRVLNAAAFTYIAALIASVLNLLYYVMLVMGMGRSRD